MEIFVILLILWLLVTWALGSWVLIRGFFRLITGSSENRRLPVQPSQNENADIAASRRVIAQMVQGKLLSSSAAYELHETLRKLESRDLQRWQAARTSQAASLPTDSVAPSVDSSVAPLEDSSVAPLEDSPEDPLVDPSILAELVEKRDPPSSPASSAAASMQPAQASPAAPESERSALSKSELIQSFLAAHNIRWGELVAGILIVGCSIGLVRTLWSTLVETHRVIPSLIFLSANAAIYAAGLYTLSRWRLRHTSRAVLAIATLLVPLSVLAGLAARGTSVDSVRLNDPVTLGAMALAAAIYVSLLYRGGKALLSKVYAAPIAVAVAGPAAVLPLVPASVRVFEASAGWIVVVGSIAILISAVRLVRLGNRKEVPLGVAAGRARLLVMGLGGFSLVMSIGFTAFSVRDFGANAILAIAIATIPALIALAATSRSLMRSATSGVQAMSGAVLCVILILLAWTPLPPSMIDAQWIWSWAFAFSISAAIVGWLARQPRWTALATLPLGMAATFSSPVWLGDQSWANTLLWQRIVGGEPMLTASLVAILVASSSRLFRDPIRRVWMGYAGISWCAVGLVIAAGLSVAPPSTLGIVPWWSVSCVLAAGVAVSIVFAPRHYAWSLATIGTTMFTWVSILRPIQLSSQLDVGPASVWMTTLLAIAITMLAFRESIPRLGWFTSRVQSNTTRSAKNWEIASNVASMLAALIACVSMQSDWTTSAVTLACASALLFWSSTTSRSLDALRLSQMATIGLAVVVGYGRFGEWLFSVQTWSTGTAVWGWAVLAGLVAGLWVLVRQTVILSVAVIASESWRRRFAYLRSNRAASRSMPDGWAGFVATGLACVGSGWAFAALLSQVGGIDSVPYAWRLFLPAASLALCGVVVGWMQFDKQDRASVSKLASLPIQVSSAAAVLMMACVVWSSSQLAHAILDDAASRLVLATTLVVGSCLILSKWALPRLGEALAKSAGSLTIVVASLSLAVSSAVLLSVGWLTPILDETYAEAFPTLSAATWWILVAAAMWWRAKQTEGTSSSTISAVLTPLAVMLVVPVFSLSHPAVWIQVAAIVSIVWATISRRWLAKEKAVSVKIAIDGSIMFAVSVGVMSAAMVTLSIVLNLSSLHFAFGPASFIVSAMSIVLWSLGWLPLQWRREATGVRLPWPLGISILAGQFAWLAYSFKLVSGGHVVDFVAAIWLVASAASLARFRITAKNVDFIHVSLISIAVVVVTILIGSQSDLLPWLGLTSLVLSGFVVTLVGRGSDTTAVRLGSSRLLGWFVLAEGGLLLAFRIASGTNADVPWSMLVIWPAIWIILWRSVCPEKNPRSDPHQTELVAVPDVEVASMLLVAVIGETVLFALSGRHSFQTTVIADPLLWARVAAYVAVGVSAVFRANRDWVLPTAIGTLVATVSLVSVQLSIHFNATLNQRFVCSMLSGAFTIAFISHWLPAIAKTFVRVVDGSPSSHLSRLIQSTCQVVTVIATLGGMLAVWMIAMGKPTAEIQLTIVSVAFAAWAFAEMAESCNGQRLRHAAVSAALITIGLWASVDSGETSHPFLSASMRWLVASVYTIPMVLFVFPTLLGKRIAARWIPAFRRGAQVAGIAAGCSLISMLVLEAMIRKQGGIDGISWTMVVGVAVTLAILSALTGLIGILTGPGFALRDRLQLSDQQRMQLIVAAQVISAIAFLHVILCKNWSFFGLRSYWPYIVMAMAFISVGATQWAKRRKDAVMSKTLSQTALYLPLIPVIGFWLSGSMNDVSWAFQGGNVRYDLLLAIASVYYIGVSALWKGFLPRVSAIVLGNAAWWVVLVQQPGWSFVAHPQVWLIPPAVCVLVIAHMYRERLDPMTASAIRYGSTLVIYISSTADLLLQQIGTNIWGPIILVLLALAGMAAGVVLRVRPFLYLGAMFVFLGVASMVWHAQRAMDTVWPWWAFGITTGICLLVGLMAIEKNKPRLREYANSLATWQN